MCDTDLSKLNYELKQQHSVCVHLKAIVGIVCVILFGKIKKWLIILGLKFIEPEIGVVCNNLKLL